MSRAARCAGGARRCWCRAGWQRCMGHACACARAVFESEVAYLEHQAEQAHLAKVNAVYSAYTGGPRVASAGSPLLGASGLRPLSQGPTCSAVRWVRRRENLLPRRPPHQGARRPPPGAADATPRMGADANAGRPANWCLPRSSPPWCLLPRVTHWCDSRLPLLPLQFCCLACKRTMPEDGFLEHLLRCACHLESRLRHRWCRTRSASASSCISR